MSSTTGIEWTDATWNPVTGCTEVSPGCDHCYAKTFAERWRGTPGHYFENGFDVQLRPDKLDLPLRWRKPRRIFVNSMSDLFHDEVANDYIAAVFGVMATAHQHTFQVLTKRHARMRSLLSSSDFRTRVEDYADEFATDDPDTQREAWPLPNVWLGVSTENQQWADIRIPALLDTPAAVRFISAEPLLGPIDLFGNVETPGPAVARSGVQTQAAGPWGPAEYDYDDQIGVDWVIVGGESGPGARPMHPDWVRRIRNECEFNGVPMLFKQWGEWRPYLTQHDPWMDPTFWVNAETGHVAADGDALLEQGNWTGVYRFGKNRAGRELDGETWDQYPEAVTA